MLWRPSAGQTAQSVERTVCRSWMVVNLPAILRQAYIAQTDDVVSFANVTPVTRCKSDLPFKWLSNIVNKYMELANLLPDRKFPFCLFVLYAFPLPIVIFP